MVCAVGRMFKWMETPRECESKLGTFGYAMDARLVPKYCKVKDRVGDGALQSIIVERVMNKQKARQEGTVSASSLKQQMFQQQS